MPATPLHLLMTIAVIAGAGAAQAQVAVPVADEGGPTIVGQRKQEWKAFDLKRFDVALDLFLQSQNQTLRQFGQPTISNRQTILQETVNLSGEAFIGHQNLIDLTGSGRVGFEQRWISDGVVQESRQENDFTNLYDVNARILGASQVPTDIYSRRDEQILGREFSSSITNISTETGAYVNIQSTWAPTTLHVFRAESNQSDLLGLFDYSSTQNTANAESNITIDDNQRLELQYTFDDITETQLNVFENAYTRNDFAATHIFTFGEDLRSELRSYLRAILQDGDFGRDLYRLDEQLRLTHSDQLETRYNILAERQTQQGIDQDLALGSMSVRHKLFESLVSRASVGAQRFSTSDGFETDGVFVTGSLNYSKNIPTGRLEASVGAAIDFQHNGERGSTVAVFDDPKVVNAPFPIEISRRNVVEGSVVVTGVGGFPTFQEGFDYTVQYFPDRVEITPILGGGISDGQAVLLDYSIGPEPASDINTLVTSSAVRHTFTEGFLQGFSPYVVFRTINHTLDAADPSLFVLDDVMALRIGADYRLGGLSLNAEAEHYDSTVNPFDATRFKGIYELPLGLGSFVGAELTHEIIDYSSPSNNITFTRATARWNQNIGRGFDFNTRVTWRLEDSTLNGNSDGLDAIVGVRWHQRQTSMYATYRTTLVGSQTSDQTANVLQVGFRRDF